MIMALLIDLSFLEELNMCEECRKKAKLESVLAPWNILPRRRIKMLCPKCREKAAKNWPWLFMI